MRLLKAILQYSAFEFHVSIIERELGFVNPSSGSFDSIRSGEARAPAEGTRIEGFEVE